MAPTTVIARDYYGCDAYDQFGNCYYYSSWDVWGRWVALASVILFLLFLAVVLSCINARRRRNRGLPPRYGTGWTTADWTYGPWGRKNQPFYNNAQYNPGPAPPYSPRAPYSPPVQHQQYTGNTFGNNDGYYGQQSGIELQPPANTYIPQERDGQPLYEAPQQPSSGKGRY